MDTPAAPTGAAVATHLPTEASGRPDDALVASASPGVGLAAAAPMPGVPDPQETQEALRRIAETPGASASPSQSAPGSAKGKDFLTQVTGAEPTPSALPSPDMSVSVSPTQTHSGTIAGPAAASASPLPSAHQVAVQIAQPVAAAAASGAAAHQIVVRLDPPELGKVEVHLVQAPDSPASVQVNVERPETLALLHHDQAALHRALDQAGIPSEGRQLTLQLSGDGANGWGAGGSGHGGRARGTPGAPSGSGIEGDESAMSKPSPGTHAVGYRAGLDITA